MLPDGLQNFGILGLLGYVFGDQNMWISWKHELLDLSNPLSFEQAVEVFYEQTLGWQLHIADLIANGGITFGEPKPACPGYSVRSIRHSGFAVLQICLSYFELIGSIVSPPVPRLKDSQKFKEGVRAVLPFLFDGSPQDELVLKWLYKAARCGLYHAGRTLEHVGLGSPSNGEAVAYYAQVDQVVLSPERLPQALKSHLKHFRLDLINPTKVALRRNFKKRFDAGFD